MSQFFHFAYLSKLSPEYDAMVISDIIKQSRKNNLRDKLTGVLIYDGERFFQYIEGPRASALALLNRLRNDVRHVDMLVLFESEHCSNRFYDDWHLAYTYDDQNKSIDALITDNYDEALSKIQSLKKEMDFAPE
ncbi:BLUF domain-containing protein [Methylophilus sp. 3sh_L]|uniref:BLUF domain-containing protein n=1 Tax=Methylophilus sp. 3sh_L TaxID=3377114 RepID=UPI00398EB55A